MSIKRSAAASVTCMVIAFSTPVMAQAQSVDTAAIATACSSSSEQCRIAVAQAIAALKAAGLSASALNAQLGVVAGVALSAAANLPAAEKLKLGGMIREIAAASTNARQQTALLSLASAVETGSNVDLAAAASAMSAN